MHQLQRSFYIQTKQNAMDSNVNTFLIIDNLLKMKKSIHNMRKTRLSNYTVSYLSLKKFNDVLTVEVKIQTVSNAVKYFYILDKNILSLF